ncbi:MAG TPA: DUF1572 family protein [Vicinamibacterales bacterium]|nr:DUF1572 family protein [Vicinamibacterales bacterium]
MPDTPSLGADYLRDALRLLTHYKALGDGAMGQLADHELAIAPDPESNSIAIIVKHLAGNMRSRFTDFLTADGEKPDRNRDGEFEHSGETPRAQLIDWWESGWRIATDAVGALTPADLGRTVRIRGEELSVLEAVNRQIAHDAYHVGQMVYLARQLKGAAWQSLSIPRGRSAEYVRRIPPARA